MDRALGILSLLIGLAGAVISLVSLSDDLVRDYPLVLQNRPAILLICLTIVGVSTAVLVGAWLAGTKNLFIHLSERAQGRRPTRLANFKLTDISEGQLELAYNYIRQAMSNEGVSQVLSLEQFRSMWRKNRNIYGIIWDQAEPTSLRIVGFISIFPLNKVSTEAMLSCQLRGSQLREQHIVADGVQPTAYFIGAVAASSWKARAEVVRLLDSAIADLKLERQSPLLLTSPFTTRGRALARKFGFRRLRDYPDYGELWTQSHPMQMADRSIGSRPSRA